MVETFLTGGVKRSLCQCFSWEAISRKVREDRKKVFVWKWKIVTTDINLGFFSIGTILRRYKPRRRRRVLMDWDNKDPNKKEENKDLRVRIWDGLRPEKTVRKILKWMSDGTRIKGVRDNKWTTLNFISRGYNWEKRKGVETLFQRLI